MRDIDELIKRLNFAMSVLYSGEELLGAKSTVVAGHNLYEFDISCTVPDRPVRIGGINLDDFSCFTYVNTNENLIWEDPEPTWLTESDAYYKFLKTYRLNELEDKEDEYYYIDKYFPAETIIELALNNIIYTLGNFIDFELYIYNSLKTDFEEFKKLHKGEK